MDPKFRPLFVVDIQLHPPQMQARTPLGERKLVPVAGGSFEGARLRGKVLGGASADWALTRHDGVLVLDVRLTLETDDGERVLMRYGGLRHGPADVLARVARGEPVDPASYYFRTTPTFEAPLGKYDWLNRLLAIGIGERMKEGPRYTVFEIL
ncbi:MAG: DUF3237 domain-containing protein [Nevskia sp.]|nr:DUF3237 domain-containing protein [Nevskia sp.]